MCGWASIYVSEKERDRERERNRERGDHSAGTGSSATVETSMAMRATLGEETSKQSEFFDFRWRDTSMWEKTYLQSLKMREDERVRERPVVCHWFFI